nr:DUF6878 family protein [Sphingobium algorifonticola]
MCDVTAFVGEETAALPEILCDHHAADYQGTIASRAMNLEDALSAFAENAACDHHAGWENGEGAYGCVAIDVASGAVTLTHNDRYIEYDTTETEI